jgi:hypothetical protein
VGGDEQQAVVRHDVLDVLGCIVAGQYIVFGCVLSLYVQALL